MNIWIERYVNEVTRRLPEKDRAEVSRELEANILDMLGEGASDEEVKAVLAEMGSPAALANSYRGKNRYLISPAVYDDYIRTLKWLLPLVGLIALAVGCVVGGIDAISGEPVRLSNFIGGAIGQGISAGVTGAFHALFWATLGFVIYERAQPGGAAGVYPKWTPDDLPTTSPNPKGSIPRSDVIAELVVVLVFSAVALLFCTGTLPVLFIIQGEDIVVRNIFSDSFLAACIPVIVILALLTVAECVVKLRARRWTPLVCGFTLGNTVISVGLMLYMINRADLLSFEFVGFLRGVNWGDFDIMRFFTGGETLLPVLILSIFLLVIAVAECATAIYKTVKYRV